MIGHYFFQSTIVILLPLSQEFSLIPLTFDHFPEALLAAPIWQSYCDYVARRFGFPPVVAQVLQSVVQPLEEMKRLPAMHAFAWCHRSDLAALGFLYQD
jgi:hypothetical protein